MREREGGEMWTHTHTKMKTKGVRLPPLPALSTYRAHMMLMTVLAILAVDFPVFPRALAKCETFGVSLVRASCVLCSSLFGNPTADA